MKAFLCLALLCFLHGSNARSFKDNFRAAAPTCPHVNIVSREEWGARPPVDTDPLSTPTPYAIIHHSAGSECQTQEECSSIVRGIQNYHMDTNGWWDIGYNFLIGGDGSVYEGRGWDIYGAHAGSYNAYSEGICMLGTYTDHLPSTLMLDTLNGFLECLTDKGYLNSCYVMYGHRQARATECPGDTFYNDWVTLQPHYRYDEGSIDHPDPTPTPIC